MSTDDAALVAELREQSGDEERTRGTPEHEWHLVNLQALALNALPRLLALSDEALRLRPVRDALEAVRTEAQAAIDYHSASVRPNCLPNSLAPSAARMLLRYCAAMDAAAQKPQEEPDDKTRT